jgi:two-component system, NarL family, response regulator DesR
LSGRDRAVHAPAVPVRVLIVDDDGAFRRTAARVLADRGYDVVGEAETIAQARIAVGQSLPDAVLLDIQLPDGNGISLAAELADLHPDVRVLLTSSDAATPPAGVDFVAKTDLIATDLTSYLGSP